MSPPNRHVFYVHQFGQPVFADTLAQDPRVRLHGILPDTPGAQVERILQQAHVYHVNSVCADIPAEFHVTPALIARCPQLLLVSTMGAGFDTVDLKACREAGLLVVNQAGANAEAVAEHALGMLLVLAKRIPEVDRALRRGEVTRRDHFMGRDLHGRVLGIVGLGHTGSRLAQMAAAALKMRVVAYDPYLDVNTMAQRGATKSDSLHAMLAQVDALALCCPLTAETRHLIDAQALAQLRPGAWFVTTARGGIHDEAALLTALQQGRIAGAGLDVWHDEPPPADHPLLQLDNVIASAHTAGVTHEARHEIARAAAQRILDTLAGTPPANALNPEVWPRFLARLEATLQHHPNTHLSEETPQ